MYARALSFIALVGLAALPVPARAADESIPTITVRIGSIDQLISDGKYLATLAGHGEQAKQFDFLLQAIAGPDGLKGIDSKKPLGLYGTVVDNVTESPAVVLVPISDPQAFLALLERLNVDAEKGNDDIYTLETDQARMPAYMRFANNYAYASIQKEAIRDKAKLLDPGKVLAAPQEGDLLSVKLRFDRIPDALKQLFLIQFELQLADEREKRDPGASDVEHEAKIRTMDWMAKQVKAVVTNGQELSASLILDRRNEDIAVVMAFDGQPNSKLAQDIADLGVTPSLFAGALGSDSAMSGLVNFKVPAEMMKALEPALDKGIEEALSEIQKEQDPTKRAQAEKAFKALVPTLKAGELDAAFSLRGPTNDQYTLVGGIKIKDGLDVEKMLRGVIQDLPEKDRLRIQLDADSIGTVKIHRINIPENQLDRKAQELFGTHPMFTAFTDKGVYLAMGPEGLRVIKEAITANPKRAPMFDFTLSLKRLAPVMTKENEGAVQAANKVFTQSGSDRVRIAVEGGKALKVSFTMKAPVVTFLSELGGVGVGGAAPELKTVPSKD